MCHLAFNHPARIPYAVALDTRKCKQPPHVLRIRQKPVVHLNSHEPAPDVCDSREHLCPGARVSDDHHHPCQSPVHITVCVSPLHFQYNRVGQLIEMVEANRLFGAQHFIFYNHTAGRDVSRVLRGYEAEGLVTVIPWRPPLKVGGWPHAPPPNEPEVALNHILFFGTSQNECSKNKFCQFVPHFDFQS